VISHCKRALVYTHHRAIYAHLSNDNAYEMP